MIDWRRERLALNGEFVTRRTRETAFEVLVVRVTADDDHTVSGWGEVALAATFDRDPAVYGDDLDRAADEGLDRHLLAAIDAGATDEITRRCDRPAGPGVEMACLDLAGRRRGRPLWAVLGLDRPVGPVLPTSLTVGWSPGGPVAPLWARDPASGEARHPQLVKVKLGTADGPLPAAVDGHLAGVRAGWPDAEVHVDVNGAWDWGEACSVAPVLRDHGVTRIEEPLTLDEPLASLGALRSVLPDVEMFADERTGRHTVAELAAVVDGVNLKPAERGGLVATAALGGRCRERGLRVQIGSIGESSIGISASAHLAAGGRYQADLDSHLLLRDEPFAGVTAGPHGELVLAPGPGHGAVPSPGFLAGAGWG